MSVEGDGAFGSRAARTVDVPGSALGVREQPARPEEFVVTAVPQEASAAWTERMKVSSGLAAQRDRLLAEAALAHVVESHDLARALLEEPGSLPAPEGIDVEVGGSSERAGLG